MSDKSIKKTIANLIKKALVSTFHFEADEITISFPPSIELGDFAIPCFGFSTGLGLNPGAIATQLASELSNEALFSHVSSSGPYLNLSLKSKDLFRSTCDEILLAGDDFGTSPRNDRRVMVEFLSPNTNKPLHLGHVRNGCLGMSVAQIVESAGCDVIKANLINDRGIHICKSMIAWMKWGNNSTPKSTEVKGDHFVGDYYVRFNTEYEKEVETLVAGGTEKEEAEKRAPILLEAQALLRKWEEGDPETVTLWKTMNDWVYEGFAQSYSMLGFAFDQFFYESDTYKLGKDIVNEGLECGVFVQEEGGAVVAPLPATKEIVDRKGKRVTVNWFGTDKSGQPKKATVLREDGTSLYLTQDLGTAKLKCEQFGLTDSIYVVGKEQDNHFETLFCILELLGYKWVKGCFHLSYGMVELPDGKMKSRTGRRVDSDDLVTGMQALAETQIRERLKSSESLTDKEIQRRARIIGLAAIKFYLLSTSPQQGICFDPNASIEFEGFTGPYCQYSYARAASILDKASGLDFGEAEADYNKLGENEERLLATKLLDMPNQVQLAAVDHNPTRIVTYVHEVAKAFNQFYHQHQVLSVNDKTLVLARIQLIKATQVVLRNALSLLGIEVLEKM